MNDGPELGSGGVDPFSYNPLHDYQTVDLDAWAQKWADDLANSQITPQEYQAVRHTIAQQLGIYPDDRQADADDLDFYMDQLQLIGRQNPHDPEASSTIERRAHKRWEGRQARGAMIARQLVRATLEDAEQYVAFRIEQERSGTDYLTGIPNLRGFARRLHEMYSITDHPVRQDVTGELLHPARLTHIYCDTNNLKWVNDSLGHQVGDRLIVGTASRLQELFRAAEEPIIYRRGGDEFGIVLGNLSDYEVSELMRRITDAQIQKITGEQYWATMESITSKIAAVQRSGNQIRVEARRYPLSDAEIAAGKRMRHALYINGEPAGKLFDITTLAIGAASGWVNNLDDVERLRRSAEKAMFRNKHAFRATLRSLQQGSTL